MSQTNTSDSPPETSFASGVLEITEKGYGFLRQQK
ncbi:hypothetical protein LCGC14_2993180, partial [marine sediment metagenome]